MLRNDGKVFDVLVHPYGSDDYEETLAAAEWLFNHTRYAEVKDLIVKFITTWVYDVCDFNEPSVEEQIQKEISKRPYSFLTTDFIHSIKDDLEDVDLNEDVDELNKAINSALNQEFTRVRAGGEVNSTASLGELYFRISSEGFNWFNIIWQFVYDRQRTIDTVTIKRDEEATGRSDYYKHGNKVFDKMPVEEFIMLKGRPVVENMNEDWMMPSDWMRKEFPGYSIDELEEACQALRDDFISDEAFYEDFLRYNRDDMLTRRIEHEHPDSDISEIVDDFVIPIALQCDRNFVEQYLEDHFSRMDESLNESYLTEADDDLEDEENFDDDRGDFGTEDFDDLDLDIEEDEEDFSTDDDLEDDSEEEAEPQENEMVRKTIQFPILIEGFDEDNKAISMDYDSSVSFAQTYGDAVIENMEQNKKFIISALNVYDFEIYYDSFDQNANVKFVISCNEEVDNQSLMNVLKRYFKVKVDNETTDDGEFSLSPILDNQFIKIL